ncbi:MAG TPA: arginyl-tRNA--protein arginylyltransferase [Chryseosolibacter sp.]
MLAQVHFPQSLSGEELDRYLSEGWFRMGQTIFTTNFLNFKQQFYSAIWLRIRLKECAPTRLEEKLIRLNSGFSVELTKAKIDQEKENLFARYRAQVSFEPSSSLQALLFGRATENVFDTLEVTVRDNGKLIGCGFFDLGKKSTAGISSFYDPDYKKHSLGKFLIHQKILFSRDRGYEFFYPGYFVPGYSPFDYKLKIYPTAQEYFDLATSRWQPMHQFSADETPLAVMHRKLEALSQQLKSLQVPSSILRYEFYDANLVPDLSHMELFDFAVFLQYFDFFENAINSLVVYDVRDQRYHWMIVKSVWKSDQLAQADDSYAAHLLKVEEEVISATDATEMAEILAMAIRSKVFSQKLG